MNRERSARRDGGGSGAAGFSLLELLIVLVLFSIVLGVGARGLQSFNEAETVERAARAIVGDVTLARSYAVQRRSEVRLVADESARSYEIVDVGASPDVTLKSRSYSASSDLPLTRLDVTNGGDALAFDSRGMLGSGAGSETIEIERLGAGRRIVVGPLGRTRVEALP